MMEELGCDKLATGHYARVTEEKESDGSVVYHLLEAVDLSKDQSYYLYGLDQDQLSKVLFPLGSLHKSDVYALAKKYEIPYEESSYRESQDLCFFPEKEPEEFLKRYIKDSAPGDITKTDGTVVGTHKGLPFYTIGQRKGLNVGGLKIPLYVVEKDVKTNTITVEEQGKDLQEDLDAEDVRFISWQPKINEQTPFDARIHAHGQKIRGTLNFDGKQLHFRFAKGLRGIAPGQSIVLYRGQEVVGGGVIV